MSDNSFSSVEGLREAYTEGDCWVLAQALHELTGWPMYWLGARQRNSFTSWCHFVVRTPTGDFLDVTGVQNAEELTRVWRRRAKEWGIIKRSSDFCLEPVKDFALMVQGMRPQYALSSQVEPYARKLLTYFGYDIAERPHAS